MKNPISISAACAFSLFVSTSLVAAGSGEQPSKTDSDIRVGVVVCRPCVEKSIVGQWANESLEKLNTQLADSMQELEKEIDAISNQLEDENNRDSLAPEAEKELQNKFESLCQEKEMKRMQFSQMLQQKQMMNMRKVYDKLTEASKKIALEKGIDLVFQDDSLLYFKESFDLTESVLLVMNQLSEEEAKEVAKESTTETAKETAHKNPKK